MTDTALKTPAELGSSRHERHFATDHLLSDLKGRTVSSGVVTAVAQAIQFVLNLASIAVLARLLTPRDFGLVAMVTTIMGFLRVFKDAGLSTATVQREKITHAQVSNLFWINVAISGGVSLTLAAAAPLIAWFYREPRLVPITLALAATFVLTGSTVQHLALLNRQMRFKAIAAIQVGSMLVGVVVGIVMAWLNFGPWSLVGLNLTTAIVTFLLTWIASKWRPQIPSRRAGTWPLFRFGTNIAGGNFMYSLARGTDGLLIGRVYGSDALGLYTRGAALLTRPLEQVFSTLNMVFVPALSRLQTQPERYRRAFLEVYEAIALASFPVTALFLALARPLTIVVLGPKWENAAVIFAGFTLVALSFPLFNVASWLFATQGRGRDSLLGSIISSCVTVAAFAAGLPFGAAGVAVVYSASCLLIQLPVRYYIAGWSGPVTTADLWRAFARYVPLWIFVWGATWSIRNLVINASPIRQVGICGFAGLLAGALFISLVPSLRHKAISLLKALRELKRTGKVAII